MNSWLSCTFRYCVHALPLCLLAGLSVACVNTPSEPAPPKETTAMTTPEHALAADGNPVLSAEEIGKRFLKLLEGLESREDLSLERVQHALVLPMKHFDDTPDYLYAHSQPLGRDWYFSVRYIAGSPSLLRGVSLDFGKPRERFPDFHDSICELDFDYYHNSVIMIGYRGVPIYGKMGELRSWRTMKTTSPFRLSRRTWWQVSPGVCALNPSQH